MKKSLNWIKNNFKLVLLVLAAILFVVLLLVWRSRSKKIRALENALHSANTKLKLQKLANKYDATVAEIGELKDRDADLDAEVTKLEDALKDKLSDDLTADEIIERFKKVGLPT